MCCEAIQLDIWTPQLNHRRNETFFDHFSAFSSRPQHINYIKLLKWFRAREEEEDVEIIGLQLPKTWREEREPLVLRQDPMDSRH